jgi:hypothetical protein
MQSSRVVHDFVNVHDIGMFQSAEDFRLAMLSSDLFGIYAAEQGLDGDQPI